MLRASMLCQLIVFAAMMAWWDSPPLGAQQATATVTAAGGREDGIAAHQSARRATAGLLVQPGGAGSSRG